MIFSINSFHSILSTSKKWRLRLMMIDVLIYYLLIWKPIQDQSLVCLDRRARRQQPAFYVVLSILVMFFHQLSYCLLPVLILLQQLFAITVLFLFFPLRGLSIFTRPNELLNAEELYPNLFAVKKMKYDVYLPPAWESPFFCRWYLKAEIRNQKRTLLTPDFPQTNRQITFQICPFPVFLLHDCNRKLVTLPRKRIAFWDQNVA